MDLTRFESITLLPAARLVSRRARRPAQRHDGGQAVAVTTIFLEGTDHERGDSRTLAAWLAYRDEATAAVGLAR